jgi:succinoglycan biosynthesis transport protein ExoP
MGAKYLWVKAVLRETRRVTEMLLFDKSKQMAEPTLTAREIASPEELYMSFVAFIRRRYPVIVSVMLLSLGLATVYIQTTPPRYTGEAVLLIDSHRLDLFQQQHPLGENEPVDTAIVDSQVEILRSEEVALAVIKELHLADDPEFVGPSGGLLGTVFGWVSSTYAALFGSEPNSEFASTRRALEHFEKQLTIKRIGLTYVINVDYESINPARAAQIANAVAEAYVNDALNAKDESTKRAAAWLQDRLKGLRAQATAADRAEVQFKKKNDIVDTGGRLLIEQQLAEVNSALVAARAQTAEAQAKWNRVQEILESENRNPAFDQMATVTDSLHDDVITRLRQQYLDIAAREAEWSANYGANHDAVVKLRNQMQEIRKSIDDELGRIAQTYKSDYDIAKSREDSVQKSLDDLVAQSNHSNEAEVTLRELDSTTQSDRAIADNFLQQYVMSVQRQSFPITESRLITWATPPLKPSHPKTLLVLGIASAGGMIMAFGLGMLRDFSDHGFRTSDQVANLLQTDCLGMLPLVKGTSKKIPRAKLGDPRLAGSRIIAHDDSLLWRVIDEPFSRFSEGIRSIKVAEDIRGVSRSNKVIGITSALPNEGKSTIAIALAQQMAHAGSNVLLLDCDIRNPVLSRRLATGARAGLVEVLQDGASIQHVMWTDPQTGLCLVPTVMNARNPNSSNLLGSYMMSALMDGLREVFDYVVVDLPSLVPVVDVRATVNLVDSYVFVIEWGRTRIEVVQHTLNAALGVYDNMLGIVLNKVNVNALNRYENHRGDYYYKRYYGRYGCTE